MKNFKEYLLYSFLAGNLIFNGCKSDKREIGKKDFTFTGIVKERGETESLHTYMIVNNKDTLYAGFSKKSLDSLSVKDSVKIKCKDLDAIAGVIVKKKKWTDEKTGVKKYQEKIIPVAKIIEYEILKKAEK